VALEQRLLSSVDARQQFVAAILDETAPVRLLIGMLREKVPFSSEDAQRLTALLSAPAPRRRYAAMGLLNPTYLSTDDIERLAHCLVHDPEEEIRAAALRVLDEMVPVS
jgi:hypothetical protein